MNTIDYIILFTVLASCIFSWLDNRQTKKREIHLINKWAEAEQECATWISMYQDELAENRILSKELGQYRNQEKEKLWKPMGKKVTVTTDGADMGANAEFEVFGLDTELVNDPHSVRYTFEYKGSRYLGYEVVNGKILACPLNATETTEAGENVETFLEFR